MRSLYLDRRVFLDVESEDTYRFVSGETFTGDCEGDETYRFVEGDDTRSDKSKGIDVSTDPGAYALTIVRRRVRADRRSRFGIRITSVGLSNSSKVAAP